VRCPYGMGERISEGKMSPSRMILRLQINEKFLKNGVTWE
jgi:hypothetical protein